MRKNTVLPALAAVAVWVFGANSVAGAPAAAGLKASVPPAVALVHSRPRAHDRRLRAHDRGHLRDPIAPRALPSVDTVGSLGFDGYGYAYNRFSGQRYMSCVFDEGYGRVRPCDAGSRH